MMENRIIEIVKATAEDSNIELLSENITKESHLKDDVGLDSFSLALLTVKIEDEFGVDVFENMFPQTISDIIDILEG
jgi:acyl carrier protein